MSDEVVVEVDGVKHTYPPEKRFMCEDCEESWPEYPNEERDSCPSCGKHIPEPVKKKMSLFPKWLWDGADSVDEMASRTKHEARVLEKLQEDGWKLEDNVRDGYAHLTKSNPSYNSEVAKNE